MNVFDAFVAYQFIKILATPWEKSDAFRLGIIDEDGKVLRKAKTLKTPEEKKAYTIFHRLIFNIKKMLQKLPFGRSKLASYAAAMALLKEDCELYNVNYEVMEDGFIRFMEDHSANSLEEEITVNVGGGHIAGLGVGPKGEPGGVRMSKFAGHKVIHVDGDTFVKLRTGKKKNKHWKQYVNMESATGVAIRQHFRNSPGRKLFMQWGDNGPIQEIIT